MLGFSFSFLVFLQTFWIFNWRKSGWLVTDFGFSFKERHLNNLYEKCIYKIVSFPFFQTFFISLRWKSDWLLTRENDFIFSCWYLINWTFPLKEKILIISRKSANIYEILLYKIIVFPFFFGWLILLLNTGLNQYPATVFAFLLALDKTLGFQLVLLEIFDSHRRKSNVILNYVIKRMSSRWGTRLVSLRDNGFSH